MVDETLLNTYRQKLGMLERVQKILAKAGVASRRKCEWMISKGRVSVNGQVAKLGDKADGSKDKILVGGKPIVLEQKVYIILNKPKGFVTTVSEKHNMKTVMDIVKVPQKVFPVGRLDKLTEGLLLLTNDGDLANRLTHPSFAVKKEYFVVVDRPFSERAMEHLQQGVLIDDRKVKLSGCEVAGREVLITIHEGRKHIVRRLFEKLGFSVVRLIRTRVGSLELANLKSGKWRFLTVAELTRLNH